MPKWQQTDEKRELVTIFDVRLVLSREGRKLVIVDLEGRSEKILFNTTGAYFLHFMTEFYGAVFDIISSAASSFRIDKWEDQDARPEVWIEKEALAGVVEPVCRQLDISFLSCRGYTSQSEMWSSAMRLASHCKAGQQCVILHFGDHDPSGIDMSRDIQDRMEMFGTKITFHRLALNMNQVRQYNPPPNPAKTTDSRFKDYRRKFGDDSWELDALEPTVLAALIRENVAKYRDDKRYKQKIKIEDEHRANLRRVSNNWEDVQEYVRENF